MGWIHRFSLYTRIQALLIIFVILPCIVVSMISYMVIKQVITEKISHNNQQLVKVIASELDETINDIAYASNYFVQEKSILANLEYLKDLRSIGNYEDFLNYSAVQDFISLSFMRSRHLQSQIFIVTQAGLVLSKDSPGYGSISKNVQSFMVDERELKVGRIHWLDPETIPLTGAAEKYYYAARLIRSPVNNDALGTLYIGIPESYFMKLFDQSSDGRFYLTDKQGKRWIQGADRIPAGTGRKLIRNQMDIQKTDWTLVYETSENQATGELKKVFYYMTTLICISVGVFLLISVLLALGVHKPIQKLRRLVEQFASGNRNVRYPVKGKDEIAVLGNAFNMMLGQINELIVNMEREQEEKRMIELQALYSQIRPHFLINTLYAIKCSLQLKGDAFHGRLLQSLTNMLRSYIRVHEQSHLSAEVNLLHDYLNIMKIRNDLAIRLETDIADSLAEFPMPRLFLQPMVENAVLHGFSDPVPHPAVSISAWEEAGFVYLLIADNGKGMEEAALNELRAKLSDSAGELPTETQHLGLVNTFRRLKLSYGEHAEMTVWNNPDCGVSIVLQIPHGSGRG